MFENSSKIVIVMEYASRGDLYDYISERQRLSEREARHFFRQIVSAVHYCHQVGPYRAPAPPQPCSEGWSLGSGAGLGQRDSRLIQDHTGRRSRGKTRFWALGLRDSRL